jgi:hypothetical protein
MRIRWILAGIVGIAMAPSVATQIRLNTNARAALLR